MLSNTYTQSRQAHLPSWTQYSSKRLLWMTVAISPTFGRFSAFVGISSVHWQRVGNWASGTQCRAPQPKNDWQWARISTWIADTPSRNKYIVEWFSHSGCKPFSLSYHIDFCGLWNGLQGIHGNKVIGLKDEDASIVAGGDLTYSSGTDKTA